MPLLDYAELLAGTLLSPIKNHYAATAHRHKALESLPRPNLTVTSPTYSSTEADDTFTTPSGASFRVHAMRVEHTAYGADEAPPLEWRVSDAGSAGADSVVDSSSSIKEWVVIVEDPDAPLPFPIPHAVLYRIPAATTAFTAQDLELAQGASTADMPMRLKGGFVSGKTMRAGRIHIGARPPYGHGRHLYLYQVLGLGQEVDWAAVEQRKPVDVKEVMDAVQGKVVAWGMWVGAVERRWDQRV